MGNFKLPGRSCSSEMTHVLCCRTFYTATIRDAEHTQLNKLWLQELKLPLQRLFLIHHIPLPPPIPQNALGFRCVSEMVFLMSWSSSLFLLLFACFLKKVCYPALLTGTGFVLSAPHHLPFSKIHQIACQMSYKTHVMYIISHSSHGSV